MAESLLTSIDLPAAVPSPPHLGDRYRADAFARATPATDRWHATDLLLNRPVELAVLASEIASREGAPARLRRLARQWSKVSCPTVTRVFDTIHAGGLDALVLERTDGTDLDTILAGAPLSDRQTVSLAGAIARALVDLHDREFVPVGLHPHGVIVRHDGAVVLTDIGLVRLADHTSRAEVQCIPPETVIGLEADERADVYALGVIMYRALTGQSPVTGSTPHAMAMARLHRDPAPLRRRRPDLSASLVNVVESCLARDAGDRPATMSAVVAALDSVTYTSDRPKRRWSRPIVLGAVLASGAIGLTLVSSLPRSDQTPAALSTAVARSAVSGAPFVLGIGEFDPPPGDRRENPRQLGALTDGDPATVWSTERYNDRRAGRKGGVGIIVELANPRPNLAVTLTSTSSNWSVQVFVADAIGATLTDWGSPVVARSGITGDTQLSVLGAGGRFLLLWFNDLGDARRGASGHQLQISGLAVLA